ncbi:hypothetical protein HK405_011954 [Cladochytrium tenue]|nr:hypothetical protein HK405_011954 [Cladochytrium tenue]
MPAATSPAAAPSGNPTSAAETAAGAGAEGAAPARTRGDLAIDPALSIDLTAARAVFCIARPTRREYLFVATIVAASLLYVFLARLSILPSVLTIASFVGLALSMLDYTYVTTIDQKKNTIVVAKYWFGRLAGKRVANANELVKIDIVEEAMTKRTKGYTIEFELMSSHGYIRLRAAETFLVGEANRKMLEDLKAKLSEFLQLRDNPFSTGDGSPRRRRNNRQ